MTFEENVFAHEFKLNDTDDSIVDYIKKHRYNLSGISIHKMASELFISPNAIMRTAKKLGYSGFSELKFVLQSECSEKDEISHENIIEKIPLNILKTLDILDEHLLDKLVDEIVLANKILIYGDEEFSYFCDFLQKGLRSTEKNVDYFKQSEQVDFAVHNSTTEDLIIICDSSKNYKTISIANYAKERNIPLFVIADVCDSELNAACEHHLLYCSERKTMNRYELTDRTGLMILLRKICEQYWFKMTHK